METTRCGIASSTIPAVPRNEDGRRNHSVMNSYLEVALEAAREGGRILLSEFDHPAKISYKGEVDIVTQADRRSEEAVVSRLRTYFPKHAIVAEEGGGHESDSPFRWIVDPLDG